MLTTSTAEAELVEVMEGAVTTEALRVMVEELVDGPVRCWQFTDSSAALTIIVGDTASWRTRHLRKRARFLRWKALRGDVLMRHQPGSEMVADVGTKPLSAVKLKEHKQRLGMDIKEHEVKLKHNHKEKSEVKKIQHEGRLKLALMMALIARGKAQSDEEDEDEGQNAFEWMMIIYTVLVVTITILVQAVWKWTHKEEHLGLEVRPVEETGCRLASPHPRAMPSHQLEGGLRRRGADSPHRS